MRLPHRLQGQKVKSQGGAGAYCGGDLAAQLVIIIILYYVYGIRLLTEMGRFIIHPESVTVVAGETARLQCVVYGVPTPVISWTKDGRSLPESNRCFLHLAFLLRDAMR